MRDLRQSPLLGRLLLASCIGLAACVSTPEKKAEAEPAAALPPPATEPVAPVPPPPPKIATPAEQQEAQRIALKVADLLEAGKVEEANVEIERALEVDPANKLAQNFLNQLMVDPAVELGEVSFPYTVKSGESLSKIAGRYMGDIFRFYVLARYNGIAVPRLVAAGQTIRIPGERPVESKLAKPEPKPAEQKPLESAKAAATLESKTGKAADPRKPGAVEASPKIAEPVVSEPVRPEPVKVAVPPPAEPAAAKPGPPVAKPALPVVAPPASEGTVAHAGPGPVQPPEPTPSDRAFQRGLREQAQGNNLKAYHAFKEAYALDASNREARSNADLMHQEIVADYMRRARAAFAKQDLQGSIKQWDSLLEFDPGNDIAQLERQKALALQERIKSIK